MLENDWLLFCITKILSFNLGKFNFLERSGIVECQNCVHSIYLYYACILPLLGLVIILSKLNLI